MTESLYGPMVDVLKERFGVAFELWDTGGGCTALIGRFESDLTVYVTDAPNSFAGRECQITSQPARDLMDAGTIPASQGDSLFGFAVGVYRDDGCTQVAYGEYPDAATPALPDLVSDQLAAAATGRGADVRGLWCNSAPREQAPNALRHSHRPKGSTP